MSKKGMRLGILLDIILDSSLYPKNVQIICPIDIQDMSKILVSNIGYTFWSPVYPRIGPIWVQNVYIFGHCWTCFGALLEVTICHSVSLDGNEIEYEKE